MPKRTCVLRIMVSGTAPGTMGERCRITVVDDAQHILLEADWWDGGPEIPAAIDGFVRTWMVNASYEVQGSVL